MISFQANKRVTGFTIVELLIVIVIIGILAAITIVAYNGIQDRAKAASVQALVNTVSSKVEAYHTITGQYPSLDQFVNNKAPDSTVLNSGPQEARLDGSYSVDGTQSTASNGTTHVRYAYRSCGGAYIDWWDYTNNRYTSASTTPSSAILGC